MSDGAERMKRYCTIFVGVTSFIAVMVVILMIMADPSPQIKCDAISQLDYLKLRLHIYQTSKLL